MRLIGAAICHTKVLRAKILRKFLESVEFCRGQRSKQAQRSGVCAGTPPWVTHHVWFLNLLPFRLGL